jgi:hypothetical protein
MPLLVERVPQIETPQERVLRQLRGAREIAAAIRFGLGEDEELLRASMGIRPDPAM